MALVCGFDEAGRGPVIGPMIIAGVMMKESDISKLINLGVKDSKKVAPKKREKLAEEIKKIADDYKIISVPPKEIDQALEKPDMNLNWLEAHKIADIVNELDPDKIIVDCPSPNIKKFTSYLKELIDNPKTEIIAEHKADEKYPTSSAASILAKTKREEEVLKIEKRIGQSIGSGYPSNPKCREFLKENWNKHPEIFRKTWVTWKDYSKTKKQKKLGDF